MCDLYIKICALHCVYCLLSNATLKKTNRRWKPKKNNWQMKFRPLPYLWQIFTKMTFIPTARLPSFQVNITFLRWTWPQVKQLFRNPRHGGVFRVAIWSEIFDDFQCFGSHSSAIHDIIDDHWVDGHMIIEAHILWRISRNMIKSQLGDQLLPDIQLAVHSIAQLGDEHYPFSYYCYPCVICL